MASMTAQLIRGEALPRHESEHARELLNRLGVEILSGRSRGSSAATITVVGSWKLEAAHTLIRSSPGSVFRGVELLKFCADNADKRDLLTRQETPCILNTALRGEVVCFSGITGVDREALTFKVEAMGGLVTRVLSEMVTLVIANDMASDKCRTALKRAADQIQDISLVLPLWLEDCVKKQQRVDPKEKNKDHLHADHCNHGVSRKGKQRRYKYFLSVLAEDRVSTTGFSLAETDSLQHKIEILGGFYDPELRTSTCTVLIAKHATGEKFQAACRNSVPIVSERWLEECIQMGARAKPEDFCLPMPADKSELSQLRASQSQCSQGTQQSWLTNSTEGGCKDAASSYFLDMKIFLALDIEGSERSELQKLCRTAMATTISADPSGLPLSRGITHIVSTSPVLTDELLCIQNACDLSPPCISSDWVRQCSREMQCVDIEEYILEKEPNIPSQTRRRQSGVPGSMTRTVSRASAGDGGFCGGDAGERKPTSILTSGIGDTSDECVPSSVHGFESSSRGPCISGGRHVSGFENSYSGAMRKHSRAAIGAPDPSSLLGADACFADAHIESPNSQVAPDSCGSSGGFPCASHDTKIFQGIGFVFADLPDPAAADLTKMITEAGGSVLSANGPSSRNAGDYEVKSLGSSAEQAEAQPTFGCRFLPRMSGSRRVLVSEYWVRKCCALKKLLSPQSHKIYSPLNRPLLAQGANDVRICISGIHGPEKKMITWLASQCGVRIEVEMKKSETTHLLARTPANGPSEKQVKALEWGIRTTSLAWLEECICHGSMQENVDAFPPSQELDCPPADRPEEAPIHNIAVYPSTHSRRNAEESAAMHVQTQIDPVIQLQAARNSAVLRRPPLQFTTIDARRPCRDDNDQKAWAEKGSLNGDSLKPSDINVGKATKNSALASIYPNDSVDATSSEGHAQTSKGAKTRGIAGSAARCTKSGTSSLPFAAGRKRKSCDMDELVGLYKPPTAAQSFPSVPVLATTKSAESAVISSYQSLSSPDGIVEEAIPDSQAPSSQYADCHTDGNSIPNTRDSQAAVCEAEELEQVMQTLVPSKAVPLSVKRRRATVQAQMKAGGNANATSPSGAPARGQCEAGRGTQEDAGVAVQKKTPQTAARGRKSASRACLASQMRGRLTKSPRKMMLRGRQIARDVSSDDDDEGSENSESDDSQEVTYLNNGGQQKIQELVGRAKARGRAQNCGRARP